ncbi:MAG TPA: hypothetical protein VE864_08655, partial [Streptosporangiaceae bacterium]|nr:hypothetical protein [Streptosporangiaceae bacterium]
MGRLQRAGHDTGQVVVDRVQVHGVLEPGRERGDGPVGVVAGPVEPPVHHPLDPAAHRVEQRRRGQRGDGHRRRGVQAEHQRAEQDRPGVDAGQQRGDDRVRQRAADDPVDVVEPVLQDG